MFRAITGQDAEKMLDAWKQAIASGKVYGFGLSKMLYFEAPRLRHLDETFTLKGIFDNNRALHGSKILGFDILSPESISDVDGKIVIFTADYASVRDQLLALGCQEGWDFISKDDFWALWSFFQYSRLVLARDFNLYITDFCTLKCRDCADLNPYYPTRKHMELGKLENDLRQFFRCFDHLQAINILGGEPLLHPQLTEIIEFIGHEFGSSIFNIDLVTNGTLLPPDALMEVCNKYEVRFKISNYSAAGIVGYEEGLRKLAALLEREGCRYCIYDVPWWPAILDAEAEAFLARLTEEEHRRYTGQCTLKTMTCSDGRLYDCCKAYVLNCKIKNEPGLDSTDISGLDPRKESDRLALIMAGLGYSEESPSACRQCRMGLLPRQYIAKAVQLPSWRFKQASF